MPPGTDGPRIGAYQVLAQLGAGGMGEVYRARDSRLGRDVAIKILPRGFTTDADRLSRFEREARVLASLNHPHIAAIYGIEDIRADDGSDSRALILELVEGDTLQDRIARAGSQRLSLRDALDIARQIADALDAAHEKGIVHRDLKPANIKITPQSVVKVLDFGLAKVDAAVTVTDGMTQAPTMTVENTRIGLVVGTARYMSPEQTRGETVDRRTDVWAFGCVVFEMLTGRPPFDRRTASDTMAAVLERDPDWTQLPTNTPPAVRRLLERALRKDQRERLRDIGDARTELADTLQSLRHHRAPWPRTRRRWLGVAAGLALAAAVAYTAQRQFASSSPASAVAPTFTQLTAGPGIEWSPSISADGQWLVYAGDAAGNRDIYLQSMTGQKPINLTADSPANDDEPAFSPNGEQIAFRTERDGGGIFVMGRTGEAPRRITRAGRRPAWSPDGRSLAYTTSTVDIYPQNGVGPSELWIVSVGSGEARRIGTITDVISAAWSPGGTRLAVAVQVSGVQQTDVVTVDVESGEVTPLLAEPAMDWSPVWSADGAFVYFSTDRSGSMNLWRVAVDPASGRALRAPEPLTTPATFAAHASVSADGRRVVYSSVLVTINVGRLRFDPVKGEAIGTIDDVTTGSRAWSNPDPSPDREWVTFYSRQSPEGHIYVVRRDGTGLRQLTSDTFIDRVPRWSPDGQWITFFSNRSGERYVLWKIRPDGSDLMQATASGVVYAAWSPDSSRIAATDVPSTTDSSTTFIIDANVPVAQQKPETLPAFKQFIVNSWSPDASMLAGTMSQAASGIAIYSIATRTYDQLTDFGEFPVWLPDSRRLLFVSRGREIILLDRVTRERRTVYVDTRNVIGPPQATRDGRELYLARRVTESDIWSVTLTDAP